MEILVYPKDINPYQELLYGAISKQHSDFQRIYMIRRPLVGSLFAPLTLVRARLRGCRLLHIHWQHFGADFSLFRLAPLIGYVSAALLILSAKVLGFRIVWTVHNVLPHERLTIDDLALARHLSYIADAKIVHSRSTVSRMASLGLDIDRVTTIKHGNYIGVYPDCVDKATARNRLSIAADEMVFLFFGYVRNYKGVDDLVNTFASLSTRHSRLLIAGRCSDSELRLAIHTAQSRSSIDFYDERIAEDEVALYFRACDVVCLPFVSVTTSGSAILALSFGRPVIAPLCGEMRDIPRDAAFVYERSEPDGLRRCMLEAMRRRDELEIMGRTAREYAEELRWDDSAAATYAIYERLLKGLS